MNIKTTLSFLLLLCGPFMLSAQGEVKQFTLTQAIEHAKKHNQTLLSAKLDQEMAQKQIKEIRAMGLPQVNADGRFTYTPQIPKIGIANPGFFGPNPVVEFPQGIDYSINANLNASQLLFDGSFLMGLKAAKEFSMLSRYNAKRTEQQIENDVLKAYCMVLITEESAKLIDENLRTLEKTRNDLSATYKTGLIDKIDFDRIDLSYSNLQIARRQVLDGRLLAYYTLKMQMGLSVKDSIVLTDDLEKLYDAASKEPEIALQLDYKKRPEYQMLEQQKRMHTLDRKRYEYGYAPTLAAFAQHQQNAFNTKFENVFDKFYPGTLVGLNLRVPIFDGLQKSSKIQQAKINIQKTELSIAQLENAMETEVYAAKTNYLRTREQLELQKRNMELAKDIYRRVNTKYQNGLSSSLELITSEKDLKEAEKNYLNAIYDMLVARADLKKALGQ
jgi:outer membrane protein TolC